MLAAGVIVCGTLSVDARLPRATRGRSRRCNHYAAGL